MYAKITAAIIAAFMLAAPLAVQAATEKKALTPQQQKMKDCGAKWQEHKKTANVKGNDEYRKFLSGCLKKS